MLRAINRFGGISRPTVLACAPWRQNGSGYTSLRNLRSNRQDALNYMYTTPEALPSVAKRMMDDGVLERCDLSLTSNDDRSILQQYLAQCKTPEERHEVVVSFTLLLAQFRKAGSCCETCLFAKGRCICNLVTPVVPEHKLWVFQHVGEFGRSNNTGSLLCLMAGAERTIRGIRDQQDRLLEHIDRNSHSTVILFPNSESITLDEYLDERVVSMGSDGEDRLTLVLLDGTSRQAKNFDSFMPRFIPRLRIRETDLHSWLDPIRRQTEEHRVCTAQAAAMMLEELGDKKSSKAIENAVGSMVRLAKSNRYAIPSSNRKVKRHASSLFTV